MGCGGLVGMMVEIVDQVVQCEEWIGIGMRDLEWKVGSNCCVHDGKGNYDEWQVRDCGYESYVMSVECSLWKKFWLSYRN